MHVRVATRCQNAIISNAWKALEGLGSYHDIHQTHQTHQLHCSTIDRQVPPRVIVSTVLSCCTSSDVSLSYSKRPPNALPATERPPNRTERVDGVRPPYYYFGWVMADNEISEAMPTGPAGDLQRYWVTKVLEEWNTRFWGDQHYISQR